jgi:type IV pilus assembly protein PilO
MIKLPAGLKDIDLKKNPKQAIAVLTGAFIIIMALYLYLVFLPQVGRLTVLLGQLGSASAELKNAKSEIAKIGKYKKTIEEYRSKVDLYEKRLPAEEEIPSLLESLSRMAGASDIKIVGITPVASASLKERPDRRPKAAAYKEIPILINAKSGYHELGRFLSDLEGADRFMKVVDIDVKSSRGSPRKQDVELVVCTYILLKGR